MSGRRSAASRRPRALWLVPSSAPPEPPGRVRLARWAPVAGWLPRYDPRWLADDVVAGLLSASAAIPLAMAFAAVGGVPLETGLYSCMAPLLVYALLGGSRTLPLTTTPTVALLTGSALAGAGAATPTAQARDLATLAVLVGLMLFAARLLRLGSVLEGLSPSALRGIELAVGLTVVAGQLPSLLGLDVAPATTFLRQLGGFREATSGVSLTTLAVSAVTIALLWGLGRWLPAAPAPAVAAVVGIGSMTLLSLDEHGVAAIGSLPAALPVPVLPSPDHLAGLAGPAAAIALLGFLHTAAAAGAVRERRDPPLEDEQELQATGLASVVGGLLRALPPAAAVPSAQANVRAGARTQVASAVTVLAALGCALLLGDVLGRLPRATLGCLAVVAVADLLRPTGLASLWRLDRVELWTVVATAACGLALGPVSAVLVGVVATLVLVLRELNRIGVVELQPTLAGDDVVVADQRTCPVAGLLALRFDGPLSTGNVRLATSRLLRRVDERRPKVVVVDGSTLAHASLAVIEQLGRLDDELRRRGALLWFAALPSRSLALARGLPQWERTLQTRRRFSTPIAAIRAYRAGLGH